MMEQKNDPPTLSQSKHPASAPVVTTPALNPTVPLNATTPPLPPTCILDKNQVSPVAAAGHRTPHVAPKSKLQLSAPAAVSDAPQLRRENIERAENLVSDSDNAKIGVMEIDPVRELSAQIVSAPVIAGTPEYQSPELVHSPSNNPIPSTPTPLRVLPSHQSQSQGQPLQQRELEQLEKVPILGSTPESTIVRFENMLCKSPRISFLPTQRKDEYFRTCGD